MLEAQITLAFARAPLPRQELTTGEQAELERLGSEARATEWLRGRAALRSVLAQRGEAPDTSALCFPSPRYSVSHSDAVAVAVGADAEGVGVDFEHSKPLRPEAARFFLSDEELAWVDSLTETQRPEHLLRLWTVKEALFKADLRNDGRTLRGYRVLAPAETTGHGRTPDHLLQRYTTKRMQGGYLTVAITRGER